MNLTRLILLLRDKPMLLLCSSVHLRVGSWDSVPVVRCAKAEPDDAEPGPILLKEPRRMKSYQVPQNLVLTTPNL